MQPKIHLTTRQLKVKNIIEIFSDIFSIDPKWAVSVAMVESNLGENQVSPTGCLGVFQMSSIAMKDLRQHMKVKDNDLIDIACGISFLYLLFLRWKNIETATSHFCDPNDRHFYIDRVKRYMEDLYV